MAELVSAIDAVWVVVATVLMMFMQPGFALVAAGFTRATNAGNIIWKNFRDFAVGSLMYWAVRFGLAYGGSSLGGLFAYGDFFMSNPERSLEWFFQVVFAATAAAIVSGAMAERTKFSAYLLYTPCITSFIHAIVTHSVWSGQGLSATSTSLDQASSTWSAAPQPWPVFSLSDPGSANTTTMAGRARFRAIH